MVRAAWQVGHVLGRRPPRPEEVDELHGAHGADVERGAAHAQHARRQLVAPDLVDRDPASFTRPSCWTSSARPSRASPSSGWKVRLSTRNRLIMSRQLSQRPGRA
jgi:hypothetical protein